MTAARLRALKEDSVLLRTLAAFVTIAMVPLAAHGAPPVPAPITKIVGTIIQGTNADDSSLFAKLFTSDAVIIDKNAPFVWRGADAGTAWWSVVDAVTRKAKLTHLKATIVRTGEFRQSASDAYLVQSMKITGVAAGRRPNHSASADRADKVSLGAVLGDRVIVLVGDVEIARLIEDDAGRVVQSFICSGLQNFSGCVQDADLRNCPRRSRRGRRRHSWQRSSEKCPRAGSP